MLILSRKIGKTIVIGDQVKVVVLGTNGNQVKLGIEAPQEINIYREEIYRRIPKKKNKHSEH